MAPNTLAPAMHDTTPNRSTPGRDLPPTNPLPTTISTPSADALSDGQCLTDTQLNVAVAASTAGHPTPETQPPSAGTHDVLLLILADAVDDLERVRIATANRLRSLTEVKGLTGSREEQRVAHILEQLEHLEHQATLDLKRAMRTHPLGPWVRRTIGVGEKQAARMLAAIGDPAARPNPAKLWQYAGHGDPERSRRRKGEKTEYSPTAKMRVHLVAESCIKHMHSPFREVYDRERAKWADRDTSDGHKHNHALRVVGKAILLDLWRAARETA